MTKRAHKKFKRNDRDFYATPESAVLPLLPFLPRNTAFDEPCCGAGDLVAHLEKRGHVCTNATDLNSGHDVFDIKTTAAEMFITNPPWTRSILHPLIVHLSNIAPTWLLFDADWMHTKQSADLKLYCERIVSVGRVSWMGNGTAGFDNCAWYLFDKDHQGLTIFHGRTK